MRERKEEREVICARMLIVQYQMREDARHLLNPIIYSYTTDRGYLVSLHCEKAMRRLSIKIAEMS